MSPEHSSPSRTLLSSEVISDWLTRDLPEASQSAGAADVTPGMKVSLAILEILLGNISAAEALLDEVEAKPLDAQECVMVPRWRGFIESSRGNHCTALAAFQQGVAAATTDRTRHEGLRFVAHGHLNLDDLENARVVGDYLHGQAVASGVRTYRERTSNLLGLIDLRQGLHGSGLLAISEALSSAVARSDRYRAWSFLYSAAEAVAALKRCEAALALLRLAADLEAEHGYWRPALDWVPAVDLAQLETSFEGTTEPIESLQSAATVVRSLRNADPQPRSKHWSR